MEGEDEDEKIGFRLGKVFLKEFDAKIKIFSSINIEADEVTVVSELHLLKSTVKSKEIKGKIGKIFLFHFIYNNFFFD